MATRPARALRDRALVLRRWRYGESSLVAHLLSREHGRVHVLAKGAYRPRSRYSGALDLFDTLAVEWRPSRGSDLGVLAAADVSVRRAALSRDLARYRTALQALELAELAAFPGRRDRELFGLAERWLDLLADGRVDPGLARVAFDLRFLQNLGLAPALGRCAACGRPPRPSARPPRAAFSAAAGGRLCDACAAEARAAGRRVENLPLNVLRIAESLSAAEPAALERTHLAPAVLREVGATVQRFLDWHLEVRPRSRAGENLPCA